MMKQAARQLPRRRLLAAACSVLLLAACDSSQTTAGIDGSGVRVVAQGPIEAFGSIVLSSIHYRLDSAVIRVNGEVAAESDLALGQVVTVDGFRDADGNTFADSVAFEARLRGPAQSVDREQAFVVVLEQKIVVNPDTILDLAAGTTLDALSVGDTVEVSGLLSSEGLIEATRIAAADPREGLRIAGRVDDIEAGELSFGIGDLRVDYSGATLIDGFADGEPREHDEVIVDGKVLGSAGELIATRLIRTGTGLESREGREAEIEGLITRFVSAADFDVAGVPATTNPATRYEGGSSGDLGLNQRIQIEGTVSDSGAITASKIEIKD